MKCSLAALAVILAFCPLAWGQTAAKKAAKKDDLFGKTSGTPELVSRPLGKERLALDDAEKIFVTPLDLPAEQVLDTIVYGKDGQHAFLATKDGVLHKVSVPELVEVARLEIGSCGALGLSRAGVVAVIEAPPALVVIDETSLKVKKRIPVAGATYVTCAPANNLAIACANRERSETVYIVDTGRGTAVARTAHQVTAARAAASARRTTTFSDFGYPTLTPDGKHLVVCSSEGLHRLAVKGTNLALEESGPRIGQNPQGIELSIDGRYVALPSGGGNSAAPGHPEVGYGTYIYALGNLQSPKIGIKSGAYPRELSLDPFAKLIYAQNHEHQLLVIDTAGVEQGKYKLDPQGGDVREFALHPEGRQMLVLMERALVWVEIEE